jgi:transposase
VRKAQIDSGSRPGLSSDERAKLKALEREVKDLRRANAILQDASIFFATALDGQTKR